MNVDVKPDDDLIQAAYASWAALPKDVRGAITMELVTSMSQQRGVVRQFENLKSDSSDLGAQIARRDLIANAYEAAFYILAHAGVFPTKLVEPTKRKRGAKLDAEQIELERIGAIVASVTDRQAAHIVAHCTAIAIDDEAEAASDDEPFLGMCPSESADAHRKVAALFTRGAT